MNLYLIRHGESEGNLLGRIQGHANYVLTAQGRKQAEFLGSYLKDLEIDYLYSSDLLRAFATAEIASSSLDIAPVPWEKIREVNLGPLQNKTKAQIYQTYPQVLETSILTSGIEGTESINALSLRCNDVVTELRNKHMNENVALVSHGGFISVFLMYLFLGDDWSKYDRPFQINNTSVSRVEWKEHRQSPLIHYTNQTIHLENEWKSTQKGVL
ncbi:histidine phosphatase family protein [Bacillus suaedae]|uniref:Histidine phosphatase family protein n=1 Tax=Halalkalibacter suaedae TaxID=2822140 RepID=A0A940WTV8_9BACI|nr:histidine phosphatase family protein [Bacillus suaedae]